MESISEIKLDLIKLITRITDVQQLNMIYQTIKSSEDQLKSMESTDNKFLFGQVKIRSGISKDQVFKEQDKKSITFREVQELITDEPCEESLEELLATLD